MLGNVLSRFKIQTKVLIFIVPFVLSIVAVSLTGFYTSGMLQGRIEISNTVLRSLSGFRDVSSAMQLFLDDATEANRNLVVQQLQNQQEILKTVLSQLEPTAEGRVDVEEAFTSIDGVVQRMGLLWTLHENEVNLLRKLQQNVSVVASVQVDLAEAMKKIQRSAEDEETQARNMLRDADRVRQAERYFADFAMRFDNLQPDAEKFDLVAGNLKELTRNQRVLGMSLSEGDRGAALAQALTDRMHLAGQCAFQVGSVTSMPFPDAVFDAAVSFHVAMNIRERDRFYAELARVMRPSAPLCMFDVMKGPSPGMIYPEPWAETEETSFLKSPAETSNLLLDAGFRIEKEDSLREFARQFFREVLAKAASANAPPPLGLHLLTGTNAAEKFSNYAKALENHQIDPVILIARRK